MSIELVSNLSVELKNLRVWDPERGFIAFRHPLPEVDVSLPPEGEVRTVTLDIGDYQLPLVIQSTEREPYWQLLIGKRQFMLTPGLRRAYYVETSAVISRNEPQNGDFPIRAVFDLIAG